MKANFGILPPLENAPVKSNKRDRAGLYAARAQGFLDAFLRNYED
jgi:folate-dependent tRNA-U54 methylase TrmFO/GidA